MVEAELPPPIRGIGDTEEAVGAYVDDLAERVAYGDMDPRVGDTLKDLARTKLAAIRQRADRRKVEDLLDIIRRGEALRAEGMAHEEAVRQHREDPLVGRWVVEEIDGRKVYVNAPE